MKKVLTIFLTLVLMSVLVFTVSCDKDKKDKETVESDTVEETVEETGEESAEETADETEEESGIYLPSPELHDETETETDAE